jgi:hypothetical protein
MTGLAIGAAVVIAAGAWLRWGAGPVTIAYEIGKRVERLRRQAR